MKRSVVFCSAVAIHAAFIPFVILHASPPAILSLEEKHFLIRPTESNILPHVIFRDEAGAVVPHSNVSTQIMSAVSNAAERIFSGTEFSADTATNVLSQIVDIPNSSLTGSAADGTLALILPNATPISTWIQALPVQTNMISCVTTGDTAYLEYIDRLAQFLELKTGVLTNGELIFGTSGNWPTNFVPAYTIELDVRYGQ